MIPVPPVRYLRDRDNIIAVTITGLKLDDGRVAFGFAYRSAHDAPDKSVGESLATKRAVGMVHAARNGVQEIVRVASTPGRDVVLKSFLGVEAQLMHQLTSLHLPPMVYLELPKKVGKILTGINRGREKKFRDELAKEE